MALLPGYEDAYPPDLWLLERALLVKRKRLAGVEAERFEKETRPPADVVGVALSGGGIRSATFCLGVFQALSRLGLISKVDYLSTVSGGGYFGAFFCRLFRGSGSVEDQLSATPDSGPVKWLRENGRYLAPRGPGDLLLLGAALLRNWVAIHLVLLTFLLMLFLLAQLMRGLVERLLPGSVLDSISGGAGWWSPYLGLAVIPLVLGVLPFGWAYWMIGRAERGFRQFFQRPAVGLQVAVVLTLVWLASSADPLGAAAATALVLVEAMTIVGWACGSQRVRLRAASLFLMLVAVTIIWYFIAHRGLAVQLLGVAISAPLWWLAYAGMAGDCIFRDDDARQRISGWFKGALVGVAVILGFGAIDSLGQWIYGALSTPGTFSNMRAWLGGAGSVLVTLAAFARKIAVMFGGGVGGKRPGPLLSAAATLSALSLLAIVLIGTDVVSHAIVWRFRELPVFSIDRQAFVSWPWLLPAFGLTLVFSFLFGWSWPFLNRSSQQPLYSARLIRAYLGASNPERQSSPNQSVTRVMRGDDCDLATYYEQKSLQSGQAPPLHLINVTINETIEGRSQLEQRDRKGMGMAIGPCAFSAGIRHHAVFDAHAPGNLRATVFPMAQPGARTPFRMFQGSEEWWPGGERLSLGQWIGISGAAFSTGLGARTNLGLSLLCGFGNVRLGYWWDSAVKPGVRQEQVPAPRLQRGRAWVTERLFPVQSYLVNEFLARFPGCARQRWYLSDGGHFENLGGYELIRRRLRRILMVDAEADPDYTFEGLANLIRKARVDFGAEIAFLDEPQLAAVLDPAIRQHFGTLQQLRRGTWRQEPVEDPTSGKHRVMFDQADVTRYSRVHAALARVTYSGGSESAGPGWLVYLKPTLTGDETADISQYHAGHPSFPQESTADQFFDEGQWESYRQLGLEITLDVFGTTTQPEEATPSTPRSMIFGS
jgi:hypothetical protein